MSNEVNYDLMSKEEAKEYFDKNYNIGYVDETLPTPSNNLIFQHYISSCLVYGIATLIFLFNPYFTEVLQKISIFREIITYTYLSYILLAPIFLFWLRPRSLYVSHSFEVVNYFLKLIKREGLKKDATSTEFLNWLTPNYRQKQALMLFCIKFYFGPQLCAWFYSHLQTGTSNLDALIRYNNLVVASGSSFMDCIRTFSDKLAYYRSYAYIALIGFLYFIDTFVFAIGYCTELPFLKNKIRTVEISPFGIFICLCCYPPFSSVAVQFIPYSHAEALYGSNNNNSLIIWGIYLTALILIALYVSASVALFTKASNLTNRGIVTCFPYNIIRHPAYVTKVLAWYVGGIFIVKYMFQHNLFLQLLFYVMGAITWTIIYYFRAMTEERHLSLDPDYREYCKKVKYKFIPKVW